MGGAKNALSLKSVTHILQVMPTVPKEDPKNILVTTSTYFQWKSATFVISRDIGKDYILINDF